MNKDNEISLSGIESKIHTIRGVQVILDRDLAELYQVKAIRLREQVKRNSKRFPQDFCFQLTETEVEFMVSQIAIPSKKYLGGSLPYAFTEQGIAMLSSILNSEKAIEINIQVIRTFVIMRRFLYSTKNSFQKIETIEKKQLLFEIKTDTRFEKIFNLLENNPIQIKEGIFFEGQIFDAYKFVSNLIRSADKSIILIDNYNDDSVLTLFTKRKKNVKVIIYTENISKPLLLDLNKYNSQYESIEIKELKNCHDRFIIIDNKEIYHLGASLKDLGKKLFAFSKLEREGFKIFEKIKQ